MRRRILLALVVLVLLLFCGRWIAGLLVDRWWAATVSPAAARFVTRVALQRSGLEAGRIVLTCLWFTLNLLAVYRAIGSVQVPRQVANLEIREALTPRALILGTLVVGTVAGIAVGAGAADWWSSVVLALAGVPYHETEPVLGYDIGLYVAQLPLWDLLHYFALLLALLALAGVLILYAVIGSVRWLDGRPAISDHARTHLGILLACFAGTLAWGYLLEPYEIIARLHGPIDDGLLGLRISVAEVLAGLALGAALLSALWAWKPRHSMAAMGWVILAVSSLVGHQVLPALGGGASESELEPEERRRLESVAYGLTGLVDSGYHGSVHAPPIPAPAVLWDDSLARAIAAQDSSEVLASGHGAISIGAHRRPAWLLVRAAPGAPASVVALADDRTGALGSALTYREGDTLTYPQVVSRLDLQPYAARPGAPNHVVDTLPHGVAIDSWPRRLLLAWGLQAGQLLGRLPKNAHVVWNLSPEAPLALLAPFATWRTIRPLMIGQRLVWIADGYLELSTFPGAIRIAWLGRRVAGVEAAFIGLVDAESGATSIYLRRSADALADAWVGIGDSLIQPASALPAEVERAITYPEDLLRAQARVLEGDLWQVGRLGGRGDSAESAWPPVEPQWESDTSRVRLSVLFEQLPDHRTVALLQGAMTDGRESLMLFRFDSTSGLPSAPSLDGKWTRFATYEQIRDSVKEGGGILLEGPPRYWLAPTGLGAYRTYFGLSQNGDPALIWVNLAIGSRVGAGRNLLDALSNLRGLSIPLVAPNSPALQLSEAQLWIARADSALRRGDMEAFGRAFEALRRVLGPSSPRHKS